MGGEEREKARKRCSVNELGPGPTKFLVLVVFHLLFSLCTLVQYLFIC